MQISWHGISCMEIATKTSGGEANIVINPFDVTTGLKLPKTIEADVLLMSHDGEDAHHVTGVGGHPFLVDMPGEFESKEVFVYAIPTPRKAGTGSHLIFRVESEGIHVLHLGSLDRVFTTAELETMKNIDILMLPVGGNTGLTPALAAEVVSQIEPKVVIPMSYALPDLKGTWNTLEEFTKILGVTRKEETAKYKVVQKDLSEEDMLLVVLQP